MKPVYLGGVRGYQSAVYRPGSGWNGFVADRHAVHQPAVYKRTRMLAAAPLTVARRKRPGLKTKTAIVASMAAIAGLLTIIFTGVAQL